MRKNTKTKVPAKVKTPVKKLSARSAKSEKWPLVTIATPVFNALKFLPTFLPSVAAFDYPNLEIIMIDDCSKDGSAAYIKKNYPQFPLIEHRVNQGFVATVNEAFWRGHGKYFFMVNQDTVHSPNYLKVAVARMEKDPTIGALGGKIYKYDYEKGKPTKIIDTVGEMILKNRRIVDNGQGIEDQGQFEEGGEVFGISGQNPLYRRSALLSVTIPIPGNPQPELFDQDFFMYKEDVDLAWRLKLFGWKAWYEPQAVAWHGRATGAVDRKSHLQIVQNRSKMSAFQKFYSIKNRYLLMIKNEFASIFWKDFFRIAWSEFLYFGYNLIFNPLVSLKAYFTVLKQLPSVWKKRSYIVRHRKILAKQMSKWFK